MVILIKTYSRAQRIVKGLKLSLAVFLGFLILLFISPTKILKLFSGGIGDGLISVANADTAGGGSGGGGGGGGGGGSSSDSGGGSGCGCE